MYRHAHENTMEIGMKYEASTASGPARRKRAAWRMLIPGELNARVHALSAKVAAGRSTAAP